MLKKSSLRIRYLVSYLLVLVTVTIFLSVLYSIYMNNNERYINTSTLEKFTYASENIANLLDKMDVSAANANSFDSQSLTGAVSSEAMMESHISTTLKNIEDSFSFPALRVYFSLRGDRFIYSTEGKIRYEDFERAYSDQYNLTMSQLYTQLLSKRDKRLLPILNDSGVPRAMAYVIPFTYNGTLARGQLIFLCSQEMIGEEFSNYLGDLPGDLYMYTSRYELLFRHTENTDEKLPFHLLIRQRGVGVQKYGGLVILSVSNSMKGLNFALVCRNSDFYQEMYRSGRFLLTLIILLVIMLSLLFLWITRANYRPIQRLTAEITGQEFTDIGSNELSLIRSYYNRTVEEAEQLNSQLTELTPLVTQHLVLRMAYGQITDHRVFDALTRYARVAFHGQYFSAMCVLAFSSDDKSGLEDLSRLAEKFSLPEVTVIQGEMPDENALCLIANFSADEDSKEAVAQEIARQLLAFLAQGGASPFRIGVGEAYDDPLRMADSYNEASAAVQLAPSEGRAQVYPYASGPIDASGADALHQLPPMPCSLLINAVKRGDKAVAVRALKEIMASISDTTESMIYYRFYAVNLSSLLLKAADEEKISLATAQTRPLVSFNSRQEFEQSIESFTDFLCGEIGARRTQQDHEAKERLMSYILNHYMDFDLSVQSAAEAVDIRKSQVSSIVREDVGLNFVQYVSYLRMNEFKRLLVESDLPITECVTAIGYQDAPNFLRKFKVVEGVTAGQYRAEHRK